MAAAADAPKGLDAGPTPRAPALRLRKWRRQLGFVSTSRCDVDARGLGLGVGGCVASRYLGLTCEPRARPFVRITRSRQRASTTH
jgi:hypothetical protein